MSKLDNWSIISGVNHNWKRPPDNYTAPELITHHLRGEISNDYRFDEGTIVYTSTIVKKKGNNIITRSGTEYEIGNPLPEYEKEFPNAKQRLLDGLQEEE